MAGSGDGKAPSLVREAGKTSCMRQKAELPGNARAGALAAQNLRQRHYASISSHVSIYLCKSLVIPMTICLAEIPIIY